MTVTYAAAGGVTPFGAEIKAKVTGTSQRCAYDTEPSLVGATYTAAVTPVETMASFSLSGLLPGTRYYYRIEDNAVLDANWKGEFVTAPAPGAQASFSFWASSCAGLDSSPTTGMVITNKVSNHPVFGQILATPGLDFGIHMGDRHYRNIATDTIATIRTAFDDVMTYNGAAGANALQGKLYNRIWTSYVWDDHDFGDNNSNKNAASNAAVNKVYREKIPSFPFDNASGVYHSWEWGRVLFVHLDTRTFRDPQDDPDGPDKSMLGLTQVGWLQTLLTSTTAEFLVIANPTPWTGTGTDKWDAYNYERELLAELFIDTGWNTRMVMINGDRHALAIDSGAGNPYGGFPQWLCGGLDSPSQTYDPQYDIGFSPGRGRWGKFTITDTGDKITFTGAGMIGNAVWRSHTVEHVVEEDPGPGPDPTLPEPTTARSQSAVTWLACNVITGFITEELPDIGGTIGRAIGTVSGASLTYPLVRAGAAKRRNILEALQVPATMLVAVLNGRPAWAGMPVYDERGSAIHVQEAVPSMEAYFGRRHIKDHKWVQVDEAVVIRGILGDAGAWADVGGVGIGFLMNVPYTGRLVEAEYFASDHKTVLDGLTERMDAENGTEWMMEYEWADSSQTRVEKILTALPRIGQANDTPGAVFDIASANFSSQGASNASYTQKTDYSDGYGANVVVAYSTGEGATQPVSDPQFDATALANVPIFEKHFQPASDVKAREVLNGYARAELARISGGTQTIDITTRWNKSPAWGLHWDLGDTVGWNLIGPGHPTGLTGLGRVVGWELNQATGLMNLTVLKGVV